MRARAVIEIDVLPDSGLRRRNAIVRVKIDFLILEGAPEAFDHFVISPAALAIHAQRNAVLLADKPNEVTRRKLHALIGVKDLGRSVLFNRLFNGVDAEVCRKAVRYSPRQDAPRRPVHHREEVHEASLHGYVRDIGAPSVIRLLDHDVAQQVGNCQAV